MDNDREVDRVLMNIKKGNKGAVSLLVFSAQMQMRLLVFLARMAEKAFVPNKTLGQYQDFLKKTEGKYQIYNIPVPGWHSERIVQLQEMEMKLEKTENRAAARSLRKEIEGLKKEIPELAQLEKLGITHFVLPKLNGRANTLQVAVGKDGIENFKAWYMNHLNDTLTGGSLSLEDLKAFTEDNYSIVNMPFEGESVKEMQHDFEVLGINYSILPDLSVGDGNTQVAVANKDQEKMNSWFQMWREKQLKEGNIPGDCRQISPEAYLETSEVDVEDYIAGTDRKYKEADAEFAKDGQTLELSGKSIKNEHSPEFENLKKDPGYVMVTINKESLVDSLQMTEALRCEAEKYGMFLSRLPGTWGENQEILALHKDMVFEADGGATYVAFLPKNEEVRVLACDGKPQRREPGDVLALYGRVERGFSKVGNLTSEIPEELQKGLGETVQKASGPVEKAAEVAEKAVKI